jgi:recombinational DNA repair protein (RecF pathway)
VQVKEEGSEANKHLHKLTRVNLHECSTCGRLIATTYRETKSGETVIEELELDVKILSSRVSKLPLLIARKYDHAEQSSNKSTVLEDTCW